MTSINIETNKTGPKHLFPPAQKLAVYSLNSNVTEPVIYVSIGPSENTINYNDDHSPSSIELEISYSKYDTCRNTDSMLVTVVAKVDIAENKAWLVDDLNINNLVLGHRIGTYIVRDLVSWVRQWPGIQVQPVQLVWRDTKDNNVNRDRRNSLWEAIGLTFDYTTHEGQSKANEKSRPISAKDLIVQNMPSNIREMT